MQNGDGYLALFKTAEICLDTAVELGIALGQLEPLAEYALAELVKPTTVIHEIQQQPASAADDN